MKPKILVATEISNIEGLQEKLNSKFEVVYVPGVTTEDVKRLSDDFEAIFTNPNNSRIYYGREVLQYFRSLRYLTTASTGTIHIDKSYCLERGIKVLSITKSIDVLEQITSTAELAFLLTLAGLRYYDLSRKSVDNMNWDYAPFEGRQINCLSIGVLGFGRLGKMYASYCRAFGAQVLVCDPDKASSVIAQGFAHVDAKTMFSSCDVVSIHIHAEKQNLELIADELLSYVSKPFILVNTSRGEVVNEKAILRKVSGDPGFRYFTDVITDEHLGVGQSRLRESLLYGKQIFITPHCGGMTTDARMKAYHHAADLLLAHYE